jgi:Spy/CpxP family protein refolding chaperone
MRVRTISILAIALVLAVSAGAAFARGSVGDRQPAGSELGPPMHGPEGGGFWNDPRLVDELGLTDEQLTELNDLASAHRDEMGDLKPDLDAAREALDVVLFTTPGDEDAVSAAANTLADLQKAAFLTMIRHRAAIQSILTTDQLSVLKDVRPPLPQGPMGSGRPMGPSSR